MGKKILITGGTKGIGRAVANRLAEDGYDLLLTYGSDAEAAQDAAADLSRCFGIQANVLQADISVPDSIGRIDSYIREHEWHLDAVVFNAGLTCRDSFETITMADWERVFFANVHFPVFLLQRIVDRIQAGGCVVFTGSSMGIHPHSVSLAYGVTKNAIHSLVQNLVKFLAPYRIRVNGVAPGFVDTEWQKNKPAEIRRNIENKVSLGRFCAPEEVADVYRMLIVNNYFNGEVVVVDGGYSYK